MAHNTKILRYDLDEELILVFDQLDKLKAATLHTELDVLFQNITTDMMAKKEKAVLKDLVDAYDEKSIHVSSRLQELEDSLSALDLYEGDKEEEFTYDSEGNVKSQTVKVPDPDNPVNMITRYVETYYYTDAVEGKLNYSEKVFTNKEGKQVTTKKTYTYTGDDITGIKTATTVAP